MRVLLLVAAFVTAGCVRPAALGGGDASSLEALPTTERVEATFFRLREAVRTKDVEALKALEDGTGRFFLVYLAVKHAATRSEHVDAGVRMSTGFAIQWVIAALFGATDTEPYLVLPVGEGAARMMVETGLAEPASYDADRPPLFPNTPPTLEEEEGERDVQVDGGVAMVKYSTIERRLADRRQERLETMVELPLAVCSPPTLLGQLRLDDEATREVFSLSRTATHWLESVDSIVVATIRCPEARGLFFLTHYADGQSVSSDQPVHFAPILAHRFVTLEQWPTLEAKLADHLAPLE